VAEAKAELLGARGAEIIRQPLLLGGRGHRLPTLVGSWLRGVGRRGFRRRWTPCSSGDGQLKFVGSGGGSAYSLVHIKRDDLHIWHVPFALVGVADEEAVCDGLQI
jgi:hypothetical protein